MNEEYQVESNQPMDLNLEVRLLTMLAGEASDFEREQLEQLIEQREDVARTYARLRELHDCLAEVGTGELTSAEGEWKLPAARRERLLSVLSDEGAVDVDAQPIFVAAKEQAKWSTLRLSKSFVAVAGLLLVVGLAWGLSLPAVQMARESATRLAESSAARQDSAAVSSEMYGGTSMGFARDIEPPSDAASYRFGTGGASEVPSVALDTAKSQLQETLQFGQAGTTYFSDNLDHYDSTAAGQLFEPMQSELSNSGQANGVRGGRAAGNRSGYLPYEAAQSPGGYGGEKDDSMVVVDAPSVPYGVFGGLAAPDSSGGNANEHAADFMNTVPAFGGFDVPSPARGLGSNSLDVESPNLSMSDNQPSTTWQADFGDVPELPALGLQTESETLSRSEIFVDPRIIVTDEKAVELGERVLAIDAMPDMEASQEPNSEPQATSQGLELSFGIPLVNRGRGLDRDADSVGDTPSFFGVQSELSFGRTAQMEEAGGKQVEGFAILGKSLEGRELEEERLSEKEETTLARRGAEMRQAEPAGLEELSAAQEAFSTFSLHVSDVSFKLAAAALSQGEWPDASKIRIEEFVNAFDYRDPLPTQSERVACRMEQAIHPFLMQRNLLRISMRTAATGRSGSTPLRLTLLLDNSGSMERNDRRKTLQRAFEALIQQLTPADQITLISFANRPRLLADRVPGDQASQLLQIIETLPSEGGTNIEAALQLAMEKANEQLDSAAQHRVVLLTDGAVNLGNANPEKLSAMVTTMRDTGIAFDAAGISAQDLNDEVLETLTRQGDGRYYLLDSAESVSDGFANQIAGALRPSAKNVKVQIEFNPQRVGQYKLLGFEKHRLQKEDFRNDQVDAAEMTAAEAGVAVYQFEARPDGIGDIGSASVRFRDLATGQMVERTWPIPYESHPPRIEDSNPSMRIAAAAALFAAKLKAEPLGASVSLKAVASWLAGLPAADRNTARVQQLQSMVEQARQIRGNEE